MKDEMSQRQHPQQPSETRGFAVQSGSSGPLPSAVCSLHGLTGKSVMVRGDFSGGTGLKQENKDLWLVALKHIN